MSEKVEQENSTKESRKEKNAKVQEVDKKISDYAKKMLDKDKSVDVIYVVDGIYFTDKRFAEGRAFSTKSHIFEIKR